VLRTVALGVLLVLALAIGGAWVSQRWMAPTVQAMGGTWRAENLTWTQLGDAWRISAEMYPRKVNLSNAAPGDLLYSLCGAILTALPGKPEDGVTREEVYRLDLNIVMAKATDRPARGLRQVPLPIDGGRCAGITNDAEFFPTYPAPLDKWFVNAQRVWTSGGTSAREVVFQARPGQSAGLDAFPLEFACEAVLGDPLVSAELFLNALTEEQSAALDPDLLRITVQRGVGTDQAGLYKAGTFQVADGTCAPASQAAD